MEASDLTTAGEIRATRNLAGKEKAGKRCGRGGREGEIAGKDRKNSGTKYRVSDSREEGE
jgi:hypothetical protein